MHPVFGESVSSIPMWILVIGFRSVLAAEVLWFGLGLCFSYDDHGGGGADFVESSYA